MNNRRRSELREVEKAVTDSINTLEKMITSENCDRDWLETIVTDLSGLDETLNELSYEEQDSFDMLPEGLQCSMRGEKMEENVSLIDDASCEIADFVSSIEDFESMDEDEIMEAASNGVETLNDVVDKIEEACEKHY